MAANPNQPPQPQPNTLQAFVYTQPIVYSPTDNETYINKISIKALQCSPLPQNDLSSLWNCTRCGNDDNYATPVEAGDIIYQQLIVNDPSVTLYAIFVFDTNNNIIESSVATNIYQVQDVLDGNNYLNINVNADGINSDCFYFGVYGFKCVIDAAAISICTTERMKVFGESYSLASYTCLLGACNDYDIYYTDMYSKQKCGNTLLIEGSYPAYDCDGNFYGVPYNQDPSTQHKLQIRVPGTIDISDYTINETILNKKKVKSQQMTAYLLQTQKIPPYVIEQMAKIFNSQLTTIDGITYEKAVKLTKNFDEGRMWIVSETLVKNCDEINFLCS